VVNSGTVVYEIGAADASPVTVPSMAETIAQSTDKPASKR
jgi:hypothetical protein